MKSCKTKRVTWMGEQPVSTLFDDIYFNYDPENPQAGIEETDYVFIAKNDLLNRWRCLSQPVFTIAETGFGTGLNFLRTWQHWLAHCQCHPNPERRLHFISTEKFPLNKNELDQALHLWPQLSELSALLLAQYHAFTPGFHRIFFDKGAVTLTLLIGDSLDMFKQLNASIDAWYLDGFAPSKNPEMWSDALFHEMRRLSHPYTTFATYTAASAVKKGLTKAGFDVKKSRGYGKKREMLNGELPTTHLNTHYSYPDASKNTSHVKEAVVIGAGIAGCSSARALADRGWKVHLLETGNQIANGASGNPIGILYPAPGKTDTAPERLGMLGLPYTSQLISRIRLDKEHYDLCGLMLTGHHPKDTLHFKKVTSRNLPTDFVALLDSKDASDCSGVPIPNHSLWFAEAGWVNPTALCEGLVNHPGIQLHLNTEAISLTRSPQWSIHLKNNDVLTASIVVVCNAFAARQFSQLAHLPLQAVRGQIGSVDANAQSQQLTKVLCSDHYITPSIRGEHIIGASFIPDSEDVRFSSEEASQILSAINALSPSLVTLEHSPKANWRASIRCSTHDHLPIAGAIIDHTSFMQSKFRYNTLPEQLPWQSGLFCNIGHGSKGLITAPICSELIACLISGEPLPLDHEILTAITPNRFSFKQKGLNALSRSTAAYMPPLR